MIKYVYLAYLEVHWNPFQIFGRINLSNIEMYEIKNIFIDLCTLVCMSKNTLKNVEISISI